jgi:hypothetical protein
VARALIETLGEKEKLVKDTKGGVGVRYGFYEAGRNLA